MQTCRQFSMECAIVLYEENIFFTSCNAYKPQFEGSWQSQQLICPSPLIRHLSGDNGLAFQLRDDIPALSKVSKWRVLENGANTQLSDNGWNSSWFFNSVSTTKLKLLDIRMIPNYNEFPGDLEDNDENEPEDGPFDYWDEGVHQLRNIEEVKFSIATKADLKPFFNIKREILLTKEAQDYFDESDWRDSICKLIQGNSPVKLPYEMWKKVLKYSMAYERYEPFKLEMSLDKGELLGDIQPMYKNVRTNINPYRFTPGGGKFNYSRYHPVEAALASVRNGNSIVVFSYFGLIESRKMILEFLNLNINGS